MSKWKQTSIGEFIEFNPRETIAKNTVVKKIPMEKLTPWERKIKGYEIVDYQNGPKFRNGDTIVAKITPCLENGKTAKVDILDDNEVAFGSSEFIVLRANNESVSDFIYYFSRSPVFRERAISCMEGTSGRKRVNEGALKRQEILIPNKQLQRNIASVLSSLDDKIELNNRINAELEAMAKTLYDYWFVQFDFPDANGKPYKSSGGKMEYSKELKREIPEGWEVKSLYDIATFTNGLACQKFKPSNENSLRVIKIREMKEGFSDSSELVSSKIPSSVIVNNGDLLFSWSASLEVIIWQGGIGGLNQHIFKVTSNKYDLSFIYYELSNYLTHFKRIAEARKTTMGHITIDHLKQSKITIPPQSLIEIINNQLTPILEATGKRKQENQHLASLRDWLLPMLMNGQIGFKEIKEKETPIINLSQQDQDQRFELWLSSQGLAARGEIDKTTLREIFNLMDEEEHGK